MVVTTVSNHLEFSQIEGGVPSLEIGKHVPPMLADPLFIDKVPSETGETPITINRIKKLPVRGVLGGEGREALCKSMERTQGKVVCIWKTPR